MAFTPPSQAPPFLCVASDHATAHIYRLGAIEGARRNPAAAVAKTMLSSVIPKKPSSVGGCKVLTLRLHAKKGTAVAVAVASPGESGASDGALRVAVASADGILYLYAVHGLEGKGLPEASLEGEWAVC